jgi:predicted unusual protein kinase regulating ubiquinone biosynthesis (AarF/ABC1/UbiB family)
VYVVFIASKPMPTITQATTARPPYLATQPQSPDGKLVYLDFGSMSEVSAKKRYALLGTVLSLQNRDLGL